MKTNILYILLAFTVLFSSCKKESIVDETTSSVKFIIVDEKVASNKMATVVTEKLCKCTNMYGLIYDRNGNRVGNINFEAGYAGTLFSGLPSNATYRVVIYTINNPDNVPSPSNSTSLTTARVNLTTNVDFMYYSKEIYLNPGTNTISIKMDKLFAELNIKNPTQVQEIRVTNNLNNYRVNLKDGSISVTSTGNKVFNTNETIIINNVGVNTTIQKRNGSTWQNTSHRYKFLKGGRYSLTI